tara:strand:+ start:1799 stop:2410 length:612 start_codon:yes stop_codon:yes gene_type:complete
MFAETEKEMKDTSAAVNAINEIGMTAGSLRVLLMMITIKLEPDASPLVKIAGDLMVSLQETGFMPVIKLAGEVQDDTDEVTNDTESEDTESEDTESEESGDGCGDPACDSCRLKVDAPLVEVHETFVEEVYRVSKRGMKAIRKHLGVHDHIPHSGIVGEVNILGGDEPSGKFKFSKVGHDTYIHLTGIKLDDLPFANFKVTTT